MIRIKRIEKTEIKFRTRKMVQTLEVGLDDVKARTAKGNITHCASDTPWLKANITAREKSRVKPRDSYGAKSYPTVHDKSENTTFGIEGITDIQNSWESF